MAPTPVYKKNCTRPFIPYFSFFNVFRSPFARLSSPSHFLINGAVEGTPLVFSFGDEEEEKKLGLHGPFWEM